MTADTSSRRLIAVDIGNSSTKLGWFEWPCDQPVPGPLGVLDFPTAQVPPPAVVAALPALGCQWSIASVHRDGQRILCDWIQGHRSGEPVRVLAHTDLPLAVRVDFPERVGLDRLAAAVGANALRDPGRSCIVIDAGTAVTVDLVAADGAFEGGVILAGFRLQAEALFGGADQLPLALLATDDEPPQVLGQNTEAAIRSGLFWGAVGSVREIVTRLAAQLDPPPQILVTGGDLRRLAPLVGEGAHYVPHLVLSGIAIAARGH